MSSYVFEINGAVVDLGEPTGEGRMHNWLSCPAGQPGVATQVITERDHMVFCTSCRKWFTRAANAWGTANIGTDKKWAVPCAGYDWHGPECNCFGHAAPSA